MGLSKAISIWFSYPNFFKCWYHNFATGKYLLSEKAKITHDVASDLPISFFVLTSVWDLTIITFFEVALDVSLSFVVVIENCDSTKTAFLSTSLHIPENNTNITIKTRIIPPSINLEQCTFILWTSLKE